MADTKEDSVRVAEIQRVTGAKPGTIYTFASRNKIPRYRDQSQRGVLVDGVAYIAALRRLGYHRNADALETFMQERNADDEGLAN